MRYYQLLERAVTSDLTIGFELECCFPASALKEVEAICKKNNIEMVDDTSIRPELRGTHIGKELLIGTDGKGAQMKTTPQSILKISEIVVELHKVGVYTNESCGLHAHFGIGELNRMSNIANIWFTIWAVRERMLDKYRTYNGTMLYDREYAPPQRTAVAVNDLIDDLDRYQQDRNLQKERLFEILKERRFFDKYSTLFPHAQGTIEWRGFRGALDEGELANAKTILGYFKLAYKFAQDMARGITESRNMTVGGYTLREMESMGLDRERNPENPLNKDWNLFLKDSELNKTAKKYLNDYAATIMNNKKFDIKRRHGWMENMFDMIVEARDVLNWLADNSERPYKFKMDTYTIVSGFAIDKKHVILNDMWQKVGSSNLIRLSGIFNDCTFSMPNTNQYLTLKKSIDACEFMGKTIFKLPKKDVADADNMPWFQQLRASGADLEIQALRF